MAPSRMRSFKLRENAISRLCTRDERTTAPRPRLFCRTQGVHTPAVSVQEAFRVHTDCRPTLLPPCFARSPLFSPPCHAGARRRGGANSIIKMGHDTACGYAAQLKRWLLMPFP